MFGKKKKEAVPEIARKRIDAGPEPGGPPLGPAPETMPKPCSGPAFTPTCIIDLKKVMHSIHESKGAKPPARRIPHDCEDPAALLDAIAEEAHSLRQSNAAPGLITPILMGKLGYDASSVFGAAAISISELAGDTANQPTYHNPQHITEVILAVFSLALREHLPNDRVAELVIAAAAHDLGHTGGVNKTPYALETRSYEIAYPLMVEAGMSSEEIERIGQMILATDFANGVPVVRENYQHLKSLGEEADPDQMMLATQCLILTEADILFSCFSETYNEMLSNLLSVEWKKGRNLNIDERIGFLKSVRFISEAATQLGLDQRRLEVIEKLKQKSMNVPTTNAGSTTPEH